jgi:hypothetical protein
MDSCLQIDGVGQKLISGSVSGRAESIANNVIYQLTITS